MYYEGYWDILDFVDIERSLAAKLTDNDIWAMLVCIGAENNLKRLNLTKNMDVTGCGLEPLQSSSVLEKIDLDPFLQTRMTETKLSEDLMFGIVDGILGVEGNSFMRLGCPLKWHGKYPPNEKIQTFLRQHKHAIFNSTSGCIYFGFDTHEECISYLKSTSDWTDRCMIEDESDREDFGVCSHCNHIVYVHLDYDNWKCRDCEMISCNVCTLKRRGAVNRCEAEDGQLYCEEFYCPKCRLSGCRDGRIDCVL